MPGNPVAAACELVATAVAAKTANTATETAPTTRTSNDLGSMRLLIVNPSEAPTLQRAHASAEPAYPEVDAAQAPETSRGVPAR